MPMDTIERAIKRGGGGGDAATLEEIVYEGYGPSGAAIMVEAVTDNRNRTVAEVRNAFTRGGGSLGESGCVSWLFDNRGIIAVEPSACPSLTKGTYAYDFGDTVGLTPLVKMHTLGHGFVPAPLHAGGLRYHGMAPLVCKLYDEKVIEAVAVPQVATFQAAIEFARSEGIIPAPESAHAIRVVIDEALRAKKEGKRRTIVFNLSGHGHFDLAAYEAHLAGKLQDYEYPAEKIAEALRGVPQVKG